MGNLGAFGKGRFAGASVVSHSLEEWRNGDRSQACVGWNSDLLDRLPRTGDGRRATRRVHEIDFASDSRVHESAVERERPAGCEQPSVQELAGQLDWLEHYIDLYGSIVPKQPDVYGEARLTTHRQETERELEKRLGEFGATLQGAIRRADTLKFEPDFKFGPAGSSSGSPPSGSASTVNIDIDTDQTVETSSQATATASTAGSTPSSGGGASSVSLEPVRYNEQMFRYLNALNQIRRINEGDDNADGAGYSLNLLRIPMSVIPGSRTRTGYGCEVTFTAEPMLGDDLLPDTFRDLVINDLVDLYSLPIARVLSDNLGDNLSTLNKVAAATREAKRLSRLYYELIEEYETRANSVPAYREVVQLLRDDQRYLYGRLTLLSYDKINSDGVKKDEVIQYPLFSANVPYDGLNFDVTFYATAKELIAGIEGLLRKEVALQKATMEIVIRDGKGKKIGEVGPYEVPIGINVHFESDPYRPFKFKVQRRKLPLEPVFPYRFACVFPSQSEAIVDKELRFEELIESHPERESMRQSLKEFDAEGLKTKVLADIRNAKIKGISVGQLLAEIAKTAMRKEAEPVNIPGFPGVNEGGEISLSTQTLEATVFQRSVPLPTSPIRARRIRRPLAPSQFLPVMGAEEFHSVTDSVVRSLRLTPPNDNNYVHTSDVRSIIKEELIHAYELLSHELHMESWHYAGPQLSTAIIKRDFAVIDELRECFLQSLHPATRTEVTSALAWAIIVESSLLDLELKKSFQRLHSEKGCLCNLPYGVTFYGPNPTAEARQHFNDYVRCRYPVQIFALDPNNQEQNIQDSFNLKRELQLAISIAVANGKASPAFAANVARDLELDINTIDLNQTDVAFSHGENTFGWRFYPRLQTPDTDGTVRALAQTILGGPKRDRNSNQLQMEPGQRECSALVVMPNFVPYLSLNSRASWFRLTNPSDRELTVTDAMKLSSAATAIDRFTECVDSCGCYRPEDVGQLRTTARQLQERLPYRSSLVSIPTENTLGGFELLTGGAGELAVELVSWYGAPGINPNDETTLFLVGEGFSVHETQVLAGGKNCLYDLLSRQIMKVTVPKGVQKLGRGDDERLVDVHIATPYGVSSHLLIPLNEPEKKAATASPKWVTSKFDATLHARQTPESCAAAHLGFPNHGQIQINAGSNDVAAKAMLEVELFTSTPYGLAHPTDSSSILMLEVTGDASKKTYTLTKEGVALLAKEVRLAICRLVSAKAQIDSTTIRVKGKVKPDGGKEFSVPGYLDLKVHLVD
ncbi:MAG: hypothetical protein AAF802_13470 [Planctomycetota bacterium]